MLYLGISKIKEINNQYKELLTPNEQKKILSVKNKKRALEYLCSHALLFFMQKEIFGLSGEELLENEYGKPYFRDSKYNFNISHTDGICTVVLTDEQNVKIGVDIEKKIYDEEKKKRLARRFLKYADENKGINEKEKIKAYIYDFSSYPPSKKAFEPTLSKSENFEYNWTRLEALLKMRGTGFAGLAKGNDSEHAISSYEYEDAVISISREIKNEIFI